MKPEEHPKSSARSTSGTLSSPPETSDGRSPPANEGDRLDSWKEIAAFLKRDERTAMRWAKDQGMPVHRAPGTKRARVYAVRGELTNWLLDQRSDKFPQVVTNIAAPVKSQNRARYWLISATIAAIFMAASTVLLRNRSVDQRLPEVAKISGKILTALDGDGHPLWTYAFDRQNSGSWDLPAPLIRIGDLNGDGNREIISVTRYVVGSNPTDNFEFDVSCFSTQGKRLWSYIPRETFQFGTHELHGPWKVHDVLVSGVGSKKAIYVAIVQWQWGNSFVVELDPVTGHSAVRYVNTGSIRRLGEVQTSQATYLIAGGFNNEWDGGSAAFIDERKPFAASPQTKGTRHKCISCPDGNPDYYLVFPRSEENRIVNQYENPVQGITVTGAEVQFSKAELAPDRGETALFLFGLEPRIHPISLRYSSTYDRAHREFEAKGELHHSLEQCPERLRPLMVRMWTPAGGWTQLPFGPNGFDQ